MTPSSPSAVSDRTTYASESISSLRYICAWPGDTVSRATKYVFHRLRNNDFSKRSQSRSRNKASLALVGTSAAVSAVSMILAVVVRFPTFLTGRTSLDRVLQLVRTQRSQFEGSQYGDQFDHSSLQFRHGSCGAVESGYMFRFRAFSPRDMHGRCYSDLQPGHRCLGHVSRGLTSSRAICIPDPILR
ncbi:hypothetical protein B0H21DRAFT_277281 [Amylocystis lapponica]|nr:hypothetical protein B0H21DRAFT_277281 [Amylocystis lapponica]